eukprot:s829_g5.t1
MPMFWDLNVAWDPKRAAAAADLALRFGFTGLAYNVTLQGQQVLELQEHRLRRCSTETLERARGGRALQLAGPQSLQCRTGRMKADQSQEAAGLKELPISLWNCGQLRQLDVGGNPLGESFPAAAVAAHLQQLEILFASKIGMKDLPNLSECPKLRMVGIKDNQLTVLDGKLLPETTEWLIAAGNQISSLPNIGRLKRVRKLMLSHNQLTMATLAPVAEIEDLEMIRVAANRLEAFPAALLTHKRLAWVALGANPMAEEALTRHLAAGFQSLDFKEVQMGEKLGSGAGATVYQGQWQGRTEEGNNGGGSKPRKFGNLRDDSFV